MSIFGKNTLVSSGEDVKLHSFRVGKMLNYTRFSGEDALVSSGEDVLFTKWYRGRPSSASCSSPFALTRGSPRSSIVLILIIGAGGGGLGALGAG